MTFSTIGAFAEASGLTIAALRHYDDIGLLKPARVDTETGYRRYAQDQVYTARLICGLRTLDLPIDEIRAVLGRTPDELRAALAGHRERLAVEVRDLSQRLRSVDEFLERGTTMPPVQETRAVQIRIAAADVGRAASFYTAALNQPSIEPEA